MAFTTSTNRARTSNQDDSWKAAGFLNLSLPSRSGGRAKLYGIPLKASNVNHARLLEALAEDPEAVTAWVRDNLIVEYRSAEPSEDNAFAI